MNLGSPPVSARHDSYQMSGPPSLPSAQPSNTSQSRLSALRAWFTQRRRRRSAKSGSGVVMSSVSPKSGRRSSISSTSASSRSSPANFRFAMGDAEDNQGGVECPLCLCEIVEKPSPTSSCSAVSPSPSASPSSCSSLSSSSVTVALPSRLVLPCRHTVCLSCWQQYLRLQITESHIPITCPVCPVNLHPNHVHRLLESIDSPAEVNNLKEKYELYTMRRMLATCPDVRWCPAPDCHFALIAEKCEKCPRLKCLRPGCGTVFCCRCKQLWHPGKSCKTARAAKIAEVLSAIDPIEGEVKKCPECGMYVLKMNDGTCNHMVCNICGCEFCWLCMSKVGDMHFLSPSGCTFWGRKPWSRRKRLFLQVATLVGAPVGIALLAGLAVPALTFGIPVWAGRRAVRNYEETDVHKLRLNAVLAVFFSFMLSPFIAAVVVGVGVPVLFAYVYTVVPVALCRSLESACSCADVRDRLLDCLEGSVDELQSLPSQRNDGSLAAFRERVRSWLRRLRGDEVVLKEEEKGRRKRRRRKRREGGKEDIEKRTDDEGRYPQNLTPDDLVKLEAILLGSGAGGDAHQQNDRPSSSGSGSQRLRVEIHAEMPSTASAMNEEEHRTQAGPCGDSERTGHISLPSFSNATASRSTTPMTTVEVDPPSIPPPLTPPPGPITVDNPKPQRAKSLQMEHELLILKHVDRQTIA